MANTALNRRDYRLMQMVRGLTPSYQDGIVRLAIRGNHLRVYCYEKQVFHYDIGSRFFEATTFGKNNLWLRDKLNACLMAFQIPCRVFDDNGVLKVVTGEGKVLPAFKFNSKVVGGVK